MVDPILRKHLPMASLAFCVMLGGSAVAQEVGPATAQEADPAVQEVDPAVAHIPSGQITLFSGSGFNGARFVVTGPRTNLTVPYRVQSVMIPQGRPWELCSQTNYRSCRTYNGPARNISLFILSARPVQPQIQPPIGGGGRSLRGMASEYFPAPINQQGGRVQVPNATGNAAADRADRFCKRVGWNGAAYERLQTVGGRVYLADVLCVRSGF